MTLLLRLLLILPIITFYQDSNAGRFSLPDDPEEQRASHSRTPQPGMEALEEGEGGQGNAAADASAALSHQAPLRRLRETFQSLQDVWQQEREGMDGYSVALREIALSSLAKSRATIQELGLEVNAMQVATAILRVRAKKWQKRYEEEKARREEAEYNAKCWRVACDRLQAKLTRAKEAAKEGSTQVPGAESVPLLH